MGEGSKGLMVCVYKLHAMWMAIGICKQGINLLLDLYIGVFICPPLLQTNISTELVSLLEEIIVSVITPADGKPKRTALILYSTMNG